MILTLRHIGIIAPLIAVALPADAAQEQRTTAVERIGGVPGKASIQSGAGFSACLAWSDGCVVCQRNGDTIGCSNIGIACQPQTPKCLVPAPAIPREPTPPGP